LLREWPERMVMVSVQVLVLPVESLEQMGKALVRVSALELLEQMVMAQVSEVPASEKQMERALVLEWGPASVQVREVLVV
jgi:uncharacterized protein YunC (DUF1805 family)